MKGPLTALLSGEKIITGTEYTAFYFESWRKLLCSERKTCYLWGKSDVELLIENKCGLNLQPVNWLPFSVFTSHRVNTYEFFLNGYSCYDAAGKFLACLSYRLITID
jgi:hypothetical protein